ncbi:MAG: XdhC/CoxI family protein [Proteobacteria bacterium]|nr:XdhC/CoxI family protein [Pseudomonadota bacterium]
MMPTAPIPEGDVIATVVDWLESGHKAALATVVSTWGSSPCPTGSHLGIREDGAISGSVSAGCVEGAVINEAMEILKGGAPEIFEYGVTDDRAWEVGLACGGKISVLVRGVDKELAGVYAEAKARTGKGIAVAVVTRIGDGATALVGEGQITGTLEVSAQFAELVAADIRAASSRLLVAGEETYFIEAKAPPKRLIIVGAVHIAQALAPMAMIAGFEVSVIDPRGTFATAERFPGVDVITEWPQDALSEFVINDQTAIVTLTHDPKFDDPVLQTALTSSAFYVGALGSRRTQAKRADRLMGLGLDQAALDRLHGPIGLNISAASPAEIAVSILAEIIQEMRRTP